MIQSRGGLGFLHEPLFSLRVRDLFRREHLQRDKPVQMEVLCLVDNPHATFAQFLQDSIMPERLVDHEE